MGIGTSDGMVYDDELMYHLGEPSARITVTKQEPQLDATGPFVNGREGFNDGPTLEQRIRDGIPLHDRLKDVEKTFENRLNSMNGDDFLDDMQNQKLDIADKILQSPYEQAQAAMDLNPQERSIYERHLKNLTKGGVDNPDGSRSSLFSVIGTPSDAEMKKYNLPEETKQRHFIIPTVRDGKILPVDDAFDAAHKEGINNYPSYKTKDEAEARYRQMHDYMSEDTRQYLKARDPFGTRVQGKNQDRVSPNVPFPNPAAPEQAVASKIDYRDKLTPLEDTEKERLNYDTGIVSSKDPMWQETGPHVRQEIEGMLNVPQEEHDARYNELKQYEKQNPNFKALGDALPAGRIKMRKDLPATQDFLEHLPDDVTAHEVNPNYIIFIKKSAPAPLTSQLQIDRTDGETNFLMNDEVKVAQSGSIADMGRDAYHRFLNALTANRDTTEGNREPPRGSLEREAGNTYNREIRRSPADGTFRPAEQLHTDWEGFNSVRIRPDREEHNQRLYDRLRQFEQIPFEHDPDPRAPHETASDQLSRNRLNSGREHGVVEFETKTGKQGLLNYIYNPAKKDIYIQWMGGVDKVGHPQYVGDKAIQPHELGIEKTMKIMKAIVEQYPEAKTITAYRAGGARMTHGSGLADRVTREIPRDRLEATPPVAPLSANKMPGLPSPGFGAMPGTRMTDLY